MEELIISITISLRIYEMNELSIDRKFVFIFNLCVRNKNNKNNSQLIQGWSCWDWEMVQGHIYRRVLVNPHSFLITFVLELS